jgi:fatty-acyl-CoA synthase
VIHAEVGVDCHIELAPLHTLPRTSSGKLSRSKARQNYIDAHTLNQGADRKEKQATTALLQKQAG